MKKILKNLMSMVSALLVVFFVFGQNEANASDLVVSDLNESANYQTFGTEPEYENVGGGGLTQMTNYQITSFTSSYGFTGGAHQFKYEVLGKSAPISQYNMYYSKTTREVYLINSQNVKTPTGYYYTN